MCLEGCAGFPRQLGFPPMLTADDFVLREGPVTWREMILAPYLPDWGVLYVLTKARLEDPAQGPKLLDLTVEDVNALTSRLAEVLTRNGGFSTGKPPILSTEQIMREVFPNGIADL